MAVEVAEDPKARNQQVQQRLLRSVGIAVAVPPLVLAVLAGVLARNVLVALLVLVVVAVATAGWVWTRLSGFGAALVTRPGFRPVTEEEQPRLHNLVDGLCVAHGVARPQLVTSDGPGANAAAVTVGLGSSATNALIVTGPLLAQLSRIELEGVLAQQLGQFLDGSSARATLVAAVRSTAPLGSVLGGALEAAEDPERQVHADVAGVRMTRYPPGLASALESLAAGSTDVAGADAATAALWMAEPAAGPADPDGSRPSLAVRAAMLRER